MDAEKIIELLGLEPLPEEGGYFRETWRSVLFLPRSVLSFPYGGDRSAGTAIYYLVTPDSFSSLHRLPGDEVFHFYLGDPAEMLQIHPDGRAERLVLGSDLERGQRPQCVAPGGVWQGLRLRKDGRFALLGTTMAPGFDYADYEHGDRGLLIMKYPDLELLIREYTSV